MNEISERPAPFDRPRRERRGWTLGRVLRAKPHVLQIRLSIRAKILLALFIVVSLMSVPYVVLVVPGLQYKREYDTIIENITTANSINGQIKQAIDSEMWDIVAGKKPFAQGTQYRILDDADRQVQQMIDNTSSQKGKIKLAVIQRTLATLRKLVDQVGANI